MRHVMRLMAVIWCALTVSPVGTAQNPKRAEADPLRPGQVFRDCPDLCPEMVVVPAGSFMMGSGPAEIEALVKQFGFEHFRSEGPQRRVTIARPFAVGKFEVTFAEWDACVAAGGCKHRPGVESWGRGKRPVINVSWYDAKQFAAWLSSKTGNTYRLLSEAEWEYAARAGTTTRYAFGDTISKSQAKKYDDGGGSTAEVGSFPANKVRPPRFARQCVGMGRGQLAPELCGCSD